jgi:hypothetical protein
VRTAWNFQDMRFCPLNHTLTIHLFRDSTFSAQQVMDAGMRNLLLAERSEASPTQWVLREAGALSPQTKPRHLTKQPITSTARESRPGESHLRNYSNSMLEDDEHGSATGPRPAGP